MARLAAMLIVRLASNERVASGARRRRPREGVADRLEAAVHALGEAGFGEASGVAARRGGGGAGRGHDVGDREEAPLGQQISDDFGALTLAHGPLAFPRLAFLLDAKCHRGAELSITIGQFRSSQNCTMPRRY